MTTVGKRSRTTLKTARDISNIGHLGNDDYEVKLKGRMDIGNVLSLIRQYYEVN
ncbi:MAG TPA: hypothetical protein VE548_03740 [Nitrososphaeraceae archaeon]|jgi:predicted transport protein|nr:hypothetical protein [Nitrososphaeraceae archaeon]